MAGISDEVHSAERGPEVTELRIVHTADLEPALRTALRAMLDATFDRFSDDAYANALGGLHALVLDGGEVLGHASVVQRRLLHGGRALRTGYIEAVAVRADQRRRGHGAAMMAKLERVVRSAYDLGALGASPAGARLYSARGWQLWRGPSSALTPDGIRRTENKDGAIWVLPTSAPLDLDGELIADWRDGSLW
jgi:aminoglycoside 2'-N-acetyltransferase I